MAQKIEKEPFSDHFEAFPLSQNQFFVKYLTFWKGPVYGNPKTRISAKLLDFFRVFCFWNDERDISNWKICLKFEIGPPAEQNFAFFILKDNLGQNILRIWIISSFSEIWSSGEKVDFGLSLWFNRISQFGRGWQTSRLYSEPYWTISTLLDPQILRS